MRDLQPMLRRREKERKDWVELKQAFIDVGVFVLFFIIGLVFVIIY